MDVELTIVSQFIDTLSIHQETHAARTMAGCIEGDKLSSGQSERIARAFQASVSISLACQDALSSLTR